MRHGGSTSHGAAAAAPGAQWAHAEDMFYSHHDGGVHTGTGREQAMWEQPLREEHPREIRCDDANLARNTLRDGWRVLPCGTDWARSALRRYHSSHQAQPCPADPTFLLRHGLPGARGRSMGESSTAPPIPFWPMDNGEPCVRCLNHVCAGPPWLQICVSVCPPQTLPAPLEVIAEGLIMFTCRHIMSSHVWPRARSGEDASSQAHCRRGRGRPEPPGHLRQVVPRAGLAVAVPRNVPYLSLPLAPVNRAPRPELRLSPARRLPGLI